MAKLIKALKKLTTLRSKPAQAAKKAPATKKKTQAAPAAKKAEKPKKAAVVAKGKAAKAAPKGKVAAAKPVKAEKKGKEPKKALAPVAAKGAAAKSTEKTAEKTAEPKAAKGQKAEAAPKKGDKAQEKAAAKATEAVEQPKATKGRKGKEPEAPAEPEEEIVLLDADGRRYCRVKDCDQASMVEGYCRYHYLLFWKNIQVRKTILTEGKLERYIEDLTARYPDKYLDMLRKDLRSEKEFLAAIQELEIDEAAVDGDFEDEAQNYLDEVRGMGGSEPAAEREDDF